MLIDDRWGREQVQEAGEESEINRLRISELRLHWQKMERRISGQRGFRKEGGSLRCRLRIN